MTNYTIWTLKHLSEQPFWPNLEITGFLPKIGVGQKFEYALKLLFFTFLTNKKYGMFVFSYISPKKIFSKKFEKLASKINFQIFSLFYYENCHFLDKKSVFAQNFYFPMLLAL